MEGIEKRLFSLDENILQNYTHEMKFSLEFNQKKNVLGISISDFAQSLYFFDIRDIAGKKIEARPLNEPFSVIDLSGFPKEELTLNILEKTRLIKSIKIKPGNAE